MNGILLIDKPLGMTSHDVVARVRRICGIKRVGHAGTLDPDASGLMVVCLGQATRLAEFLTGQSKRYTATLQLGLRTSSQDISGAVLTTSDASSITEPQFMETARKFSGEIDQIPPMVSALHHEGKRLYDLARQGIVVERQPRRITVEYLTVLEFRGGVSAEADLDIKCSKGTYIRTICFDIGDSLGVGGTMKSLRRTESGSFHVKSAVQLHNLDATAIAGVLIRPGQALGTLPHIVVSAHSAQELKHGRRCLTDTPDCECLSVLDSTDELVAICSALNGELIPHKVFNN